MMLAKFAAAARVGIGVAAVCLLALPSTSDALVSKIEQKCASKLAKAARKVGETQIKLTAKCRDRDLSGKEVGACPDAKTTAAVAKATAKLTGTAAKSCTSTCSTSVGVSCIADSSCPTRLNAPETCGGFPVSRPFDVSALNFPGPLCESVLGGSISTTDDIAACVATLMGTTADEYIAAVYGSLTNGADVAGADKCLRTIAGAGRKMASTIYKSISKCHDAINAGKQLTNPLTCLRDDSLARQKVEKAEGKLRSKIGSSCDDAAVQKLDLCGNGIGGTLAVGDAADCIVDLAFETADTTEIPTLREYTSVTFIEAVYPPPAICGDGVINQTRSSRMRRGEECDGPADLACPGECLPPGDVFECTCGDIPRVRFISDALDPQTQTDAGFRGVSHDQDVADMSGEVAELTDCNCASFTDATCDSSSDPVCDTTGEERPRCSWAPDAPGRCDDASDFFTCIDHDDPVRIGSPCTTDADCPCAGVECPTLTCPTDRCSLGVNDGSGAALECTTNGDCANPLAPTCQSNEPPNSATCNLCVSNEHRLHNGVDSDADCAICDSFSVNAGEFCEFPQDCEAQCYDDNGTPSTPCVQQEDCAAGEVCRGRCDTSHSCLLIYEGGPQPVDTAGSFVCTTQQYIDDFAGTRNIITGEHERNYLIRSKVFTGEIASRPCPVCGGFCVDMPGKEEFQVCSGRCLVGGEECRFDADCAPGDECGPLTPDCPGGRCQLSLVCASTAPSDVLTGKPCEITYEHRAFGTVSNDCLPQTANISGQGLLVEFQPATGKATSLAAQVGGPFPCTRTNLGLYDCHCPGRRCSSSGDGCVVDLDCPGGETCDPGGEPTKPNECANACNAGVNENFGCATGGGQPGAATTCDAGPNFGQFCDEDADCCLACSVSGTGCASAADCPSGQTCDETPACGFTCSVNPTHCEGTGDPDLERAPCTTNGDCAAGTCVDACPGGRCVPLCVPLLGFPLDGICAAGPPTYRCEAERFRLKTCSATSAGETCDATCSVSGTPCTSITECPSGEICEGPCASHIDCEAGFDGILGNDNDLVGAGSCLALDRDCFLPDVEIDGAPIDHTNFGSDGVWCQRPVIEFIDSGAGFPGPNRTRKRGVNVINVPSIP